MAGDETVFSHPEALTRLQRELIVAFLPRAPDFFLTRGIRVDTLPEMAANKVAALVGRSEVRDLVDLQQLLGAGLSLEDALRGAARKDAGVDAATLAWTLDQLSLAPGAKLPGGASAVELDVFRRALVTRCRALALGAVRR